LRLVSWQFNATGGNFGRIGYPRSAAISAVVGGEEYDAMACAGDFAERDQLNGARGTLRR
jgi:hypothetical protein